MTNGDLVIINNAHTSENLLLILRAEVGFAFKAFKKGKVPAFDYVSEEHGPTGTIAVKVC